MWRRLKTIFPLKRLATCWGAELGDSSEELDDGTLGGNWDEVMGRA